MGHAVFKQPGDDNLVCVYSSISGGFVLTDATPKEFKAWWVKRAKAEARREADSILRMVAERGHNHTIRTLAEAIESDRDFYLSDLDVPRDEALEAAEWRNRMTAALDAAEEKVQ